MPRAPEELLPEAPIEPAYRGDVPSTSDSPSGIGRGIESFVSMPSMERAAVGFGRDRSARSGSQA